MIGPIKKIFLQFICESCFWHLRIMIQAQNSIRHQTACFLHSQSTWIMSFRKHSTHCWSSLSHWNTCFTDINDMLLLFGNVCLIRNMVQLCNYHVATSTSTCCTSSVSHAANLLCNVTLFLFFFCHLCSGRYGRVNFRRSLLTLQCHTFNSGWIPVPLCASCGCYASTQRYGAAPALWQK